MTKEDEEFYLDNCFGPYEATCTNTVHLRTGTNNNKWKETWHKSVKKRRRSTESSLVEQKEVDELEMREMLAAPVVEIDDDPNFQYETPSEQTILSGRSFVLPQKMNAYQLRSQKKKFCFQEN